MKPKIWYDVFDEFITCVNNTEINLFVDTGTLLGFVRDGDFIAWDNDIDFGTTCEDKIQIEYLIEALKKKRFEIYNFHTDYVFSKGNISIELKVYKKVGVSYRSSFHKYENVNKVQLYLYLLQKKIFKSYHGRFFKKLLFIILSFYSKYSSKRINLVHETKIIDIPEIFFQKLDEIHIFGNKALIPTAVDNYLEFRYGPALKTPIRNYNYFEEDGSIK